MAAYKHNKLRVYVHFVWATWDRLPLLTEDIERRVHRYLETVCQETGCDVFAVNGMPDHVHVFVALPATISLSELVKKMKGGTSRLVSSELKPDAWFAWQRHYAAFSVPRKDIGRVTAYIENQKQHHAAGDLWPEAEEVFEEGERKTQNTLMPSHRR